MGREVVLLLDKEFLKCEQLLFHPMQSDHTTAISPDQLTSFLEQVAPGRFMYVDLTTSDKITLPEIPAPGAATAAKPAKADTAKSPAPESKHEPTKPEEQVKSRG